jgi:hypothetical protein
VVSQAAATLFGHCQTSQASASFKKRSTIERAASFFSVNACIFLPYSFFSKVQVQLYMYARPHAFVVSTHHAKMLSLQNCAV